jgi:hypothetical protein
MAALIESKLGKTVGPSFDVLVVTVSLPTLYTARRRGTKRKAFGPVSRGPCSCAPSDFLKGATGSHPTLIELTLQSPASRHRDRLEQM